MKPVIAFPSLAGMDYPDLDQLRLRRVIAGPEEFSTLSDAERADVKVLMTSASRGVKAEWLTQLPNLRLVISQGAGADMIDTEALSLRRIRLRRISETVVEDVADLALTFALSLCRRLRQAEDFARSPRWAAGRFMLTDSLYHKKIAIAGLSGNIGRAIAQRARAFDTQILGLDRVSNQGLADAYYPDWQSLSAASDILIIALPGHRELHHLVNSDLLAALGPRGYLINVGRGSLVHTGDLIAALENGTIAGAALDVLDEEPQPPASLLACPNLILTPHYAAQTWTQRARGAAIAQAEILSELREIV